MPLDGSPLSEEVMEPMLTSLGPLAADVILLQVVPRTTVPTVYLSDRSDAAMSGAQECLDAATRLWQRGLQVTAFELEAGSPGTRDFQDRCRAGGGPDRDGDARTHGGGSYRTRQRLN